MLRAAAMCVYNSQVWIRALAITAVLGVSVWTSEMSASAATTAPGWAVKVVAMPTQFSSADTAKCSSNERCDKYVVVVTNTGGAASTGDVVIKDRIPAVGVTFFKAKARDLSTSAAFSCLMVGAVIECTDTQPVQPYSSVLVEVKVKTEAGTESNLEDIAEVQGGGGDSASASIRNLANASSPPAFGVTDFGLGVYRADGELDRQAGDRPTTVTSSFDLANVFTPTVGFSSYLAVEEPKTVTVELPLGLVGNPGATAERCPEVDLAAKPETVTPGFTSSCPPRRSNCLSASRRPASRSSWC